jgi:hypothetical protein
MEEKYEGKARGESVRGKRARGKCGREERVRIEE